MEKLCRSSRGGSRVLCGDVRILFTSLGAVERAERKCVWNRTPDAPSPSE